MASIKITFRDGTVKQFPHEGRAGGSYTKRVRYEGAFVIVVDEWGKESAYPIDTVKEVESSAERASL